MAVLHRPRARCGHASCSRTTADRPASREVAVDQVRRPGRHTIGQPGEEVVHAAGHRPASRCKEWRSCRRAWARDAAASATDDALQAQQARWVLLCRMEEVSDGSTAPRGLTDGFRIRSFVSAL